MPDYRITRATEQHVDAMAPNVRQADINELAAASGNAPREALMQGLNASGGYAWAGLADDEVVCIFGVAPLNLLSDVGIPWMLGTPLIEKHSRVFLRRSKKYVEAMRERYGRLYNFVDDRNDAAKQWLAWLGFTLHEPEPYGVSGLPFRKFEMIGAKYV